MAHTNKVLGITLLPIARPRIGGFNRKDTCPRIKIVPKLRNQDPMPHLFAIALCILILAGLAGLVRLEYQRSRKGPRMSSAAFFRGGEDPQHRDASLAPRSGDRAIRHEIGY